jgi:hypothetical protein
MSKTGTIISLKKLCKWPHEKLAQVVERFSSMLETLGSISIEQNKHLLKKTPNTQKDAQH